MRFVVLTQCRTKTQCQLIWTCWRVNYRTTLEYKSLVWVITSTKTMVSASVGLNQFALHSDLSSWINEIPMASSQWRHNGRDGVSNHRRPDCLLDSLFWRRSKKHQSPASLTFVRGIHRWPVNSPHKGPVTRKMYPLDDVIMVLLAAKFGMYHGISVLWFEKGMCMY